MGRLADWLYYKALPAWVQQLKRLPRPVQVLVVVVAVLLFLAFATLVGAVITLGRSAGGGVR